MYANVDGFDNAAPQVPDSERPEIDRWILSELNTLVKNVTACYEDFEPTRAGRLMESFVINNLSNWFVRLSRKRFWAGEMTSDKLSAYQSLYTCLLTVSKLMAPIAPFYADRLYKDLVSAVNGENEAGSVHLAKFPVVNEKQIDVELEKRMELAQQITSMVLSLRKKEHIIVRQPLQCISIPVSDATQKARIQGVQQLILDEVNVKELRFVEGAMLEKKVKCNFRIMGKKFGKLMKAVSNAVTSMSQEEIQILESTGSFELNVSGEAVVIERTDVDIVSEDMPGWSVANEGTLTVALDLEITEALRQEGLARELVKRIQSYRKEHDFQITDRISVLIEENAAMSAVLDVFGEYISKQVLAENVSMVAAALDENKSETFDFEDFKLKVKIENLSIK